MSISTCLKYTIFAGFLGLSACGGGGGGSSSGSSSGGTGGGTTTVSVTAGAAKLSSKALRYSFLPRQVMPRAMLGARPLGLRLRLVLRLFQIRRFWRLV